MSHLAERVTERQLSQHIVNLARMLGWKVARWPTWRATGTDLGVPDLILARGGKVLLVELKTDKGRLSGPQQEWQEEAGEHALVWRTEDWYAGRVEELLKR